MQLPVGYVITVTPEGGRSTNYTVFLSFEGKQVGNVRVLERAAICGGHKVKVHETHSSLAEGHWGRGLGLAMYSAAIDFALERDYSIVSSYSPSARAQRVWKSTRLAKRYVVNKLSKRWWVTRLRTDEEQ